VNPDLNVALTRNGKPSAGGERETYNPPVNSNWLKCKLSNLAPMATFEVA